MQHPTRREGGDNMLTRSGAFGTTRQETLAVCRQCSTSWAIDVPVDPELVAEEGFELVDGAWTGLCESCQEKKVDASNAEYEALARAAAELGRLHHVSPMAAMVIPEAEGFELEGSGVFGFWAFAADLTDDGRARFGETLKAVVGNLNLNRGTSLVDNLGANGRQAIVHGVLD
ncbi:MAG: hypothetical protein GY898_23070 [Proteobacteria bacterium]|nr:hypothetical protein [Pseudomonadota bacterium]